MTDEELARWCAELLGYKPVGKWHQEALWFGKRCFDPLRLIADAWLVVEAMRERGWCLAMGCETEELCFWPISVRGKKPTNWYPYNDTATTCSAIVLAAREALGEGKG